MVGAKALLIELYHSVCLMHDDFIYIDYFRRKGVCPLTVKELFDFVTDITITPDNIEEYLDKAMEMSASRTIDDLTQQEKVDEEVQ